MRHVVVILLVLITSGVIVANIVAARNPLRRTLPEIRQTLLREAPLGSSSEQVRVLIARKGWHSKWESWGGIKSPQYGLQGTHQIGAALGDYGFPWPCHVSASWGFDREPLVDVRVDRACDGI